MPRLLDAYCCAGVGADGYRRAGFDEIIGVDKDPQPNYPYTFVQGDALEAIESVLSGELVVDAIHASAPCQRFTAYRRKGHGVGDGYLDLIQPTRELLRETGLPWVMENVHGAPLNNAIRLCGSSFGLDVRRHRFFESNVPLMALPCNHSAQAPGRFPGATNREPMSRATVEIGVWRIPLEVQKRAMGVDREITLRELSEGHPARVHRAHRPPDAHRHRRRRGGGRMTKPDPAVWRARHEPPRRPMVGSESERPEFDPTRPPFDNGAAAGVEPAKNAT